MAAAVAIPAQQHYRHTCLGFLYAGLVGKIGTLIISASASEYFIQNIIRRISQGQGSVHTTSCLVLGKLRLAAATTLLAFSLARIPPNYNVRSP